jgi:hypothetical protein
VAAELYHLQAVIIEDLPNVLLRLGVDLRGNVELDTVYSFDLAAHFETVQYGDRILKALDVKTVREIVDAPDPHGNL